MFTSAPSSTLLIALGAMLWGGDVLLRPQALASGWSPACVVLGEHLLLTLAFLPVLWRGRRLLAGLNGPQWAALFFVAWGGSALATWLYTQAFTLGAPLTVVLLQKTQPVLALVLAWAVLGERRRAGFWGWCLLALAGAWLLAGLTRVPSLRDTHAQQALCALGAAALWGGATVAGRLLTPALSPALLAGARFALAVPPLALLALLPSGVAHPASAPVSNAQALLFLLLIVLLPDLAGMALYYRGLRGTPASVATLVELCYPLTSLLIGLFLQHTLLTSAQWAGLCLLVIAVLGLGLTPGVVRVTRRSDPSPAITSAVVWPPPPNLPDEA